jgi:hypothetical protein
MISPESLALKVLCKGLSRAAATSFKPRELHTGDEHIGALFNEPFGGREADAAAASCDDGDLVFQ